MVEKNIYHEVQFILQWKKDEKKPPTNEEVPSTANLSNREIELLRLLAAGKSNKEISQDLNIEVSTVKTHVRNICKKLNLANRKEARKFQ